VKSGTERNPNPHEPSLGAFLRSLQSHVNDGYVLLKNGQTLREDTWERWQVQGYRGRA